MPLLPPLPPEHSPEVAELAKFFNETLGFAPNSILTMQRRPEIAKAFIALNKAVMDPSHGVPSALKRLIGYMASHAAGCRYCQAHTALAATRYGTEAEKMNAIWEFRTSPLYTPAERAALEFALAAASVPNAVTDEIGDELKRHWNEGQIVEILGVVALFGYLNRWNDSMGTVLEDGAASIGQTYLTQHGWTRGKHVAG